MRIVLLLLSRRFGRLLDLGNDLVGGFVPLQIAQLGSNAIEQIPVVDRFGDKFARSMFT